jgi:ribosomal protein S17
LSTGSQKFVAIAHENLKKEITLDKKKYMKALRDILALVKEEEKLRKADVMGVSETTPLVMSYQDLA